MNLRYQLYDYFFGRTEKETCHKVFSKRIAYYQHLDEKGQREFVIRTLVFLKSVNIQSEPGFYVSREMKLLLGSAFVQITFGLRRDVLEHFKRIFIFSRPYSYKNMNTLFNGDVNPLTGSVNLSWPAVEMGFVVPTEGANLAIHEFGHCLILENRLCGIIKKILHPKHLQSWERLGLKQLVKIRQGKSELFRRYAGTNLMELFSASLENFFEKPYAFYAENPALYKSMCLLLRQDPRDPKTPTGFLHLLK
ncbi:zinc-dependent peptidase [Robertkochia sediminum]|uniref:zinc-dependent peptidase n=1 Tax=Robertkochia sediminum TaxID=2785326 RepID=UPI0019347371|nr:zinc-dependent peptidase [Robertkochia sediminum]MBL7471545.1 zinc-dependent peptidase [Robertkochia sediminum]